MTNQPDSVCSIASTHDGTGKAACLMRWGRIEALLEPALVVSTARELTAAADRAETDTALMGAFREDFQTDDTMLAAVLHAVRARRPAPTGRCALRIEAVAGARTGLPYVTISRGSMRGQITPDEARNMATQWIETAVAARIDVRMRYALGEWDRLDAAEIEELFQLVQKVQR